jgi:hypothetical protein
MVMSERQSERLRSASASHHARHSAGQVPVEFAVGISNDELAAVDALL